MIHRTISNLKLRTMTNLPAHECVSAIRKIIDGFPRLLKIAHGAIKGKNNENTEELENPQDAP